MHGCANAIEKTVHHLECGDDAHGSFGRRRSGDVDERVPFWGGIPRWPRAQRVAEGDQLGSVGDEWRGAGGNR